ncbi:MAG: hypothetical protein A3H33_14490 [Betaproteobacteria bacterium RIFCSPLOWO2_02_FULL_65_20]|nr:MAG: hypothetical protein A3H33_14490 [Betaproteobacteria bacterium RIFCSPLOWO2_02_FULL_65_20]
MNGERFAGICLQIAGRMNEAWGELTGDPLRAAAGRRDQSFGKAQQRSGMAKEESNRQMSDFLTRNRDWYV